MDCKKFAPILFLVVICFKYGSNEKNESVTGIWKRLFVSKDGSTMSPYSLLMLNQTYNDTPICSQDLQLNDDVNVDFCITPALMNWESNPPDQVAVTHTNQFGEILNIVVFNNSDEYGSTSRESWFNASYIVRSTEYSGRLLTSTNLHPFERNFVISNEGLWYCNMNSMSVKVNISNYIQSRWHHLMRTNAYLNTYYFSGRSYTSYCYRDVNHTLNIPEEDCLQSGTENCLLCCKLLKKNFALLKYDNKHYTCSCSEEWPTEMLIDYYDLPRHCEGSCANTSLGFCYYIHNTKGMFIVEDTVHSYSEDKDIYYFYFSYNESRIAITFKKRYYTNIVCGVSFYSPTLYPEWILLYNASSTVDYLIPMSYSRKIYAKFIKDDKGQVYTRLDFGPIISEQISIQPANGVNLTNDIKFLAYYTQKNVFSEDSQYHKYNYEAFIHAPYLILQGLWNDSYLNTAETLDPHESTDISTFDSRSAYYLTSFETSTEVPNTATLGEEHGINEAYSVTQNGQSYRCKCFPEPNITLTVELEEGIKDAIKSNLTVPTDSLSSTSRKKNSAQDDRSSSKTIGCFGIILLSLEFALLIFLDSTYFIQGIYNLYQKFSLGRQK